MTEILDWESRAHERELREKKRLAERVFNGANRLVAKAFTGFGLPEGADADYPHFNVHYSGSQGGHLFTVDVSKVQRADGQSQDLRRVQVVRPGGDPSNAINGHFNSAGEMFDYDIDDKVYYPIGISEGNLRDMAGCLESANLERGKYTVILTDRF